MQYQIRLASRSEVQKLPSIEQAASTRFNDYLTQLELTPDLMSEIVSVQFLLQAQTEKRLWVAIVEDRPVGFVVSRPLLDSFFIVELDVLPDFGRCGLGSALMQAACAQAQENGFKAVTLTTFRTIPWNIPFYQRLGFTILAPEDLSPELDAIVQHEARYGFKRQYRVVMQRLLR